MNGSLVGNLETMILGVLEHSADIIVRYDLHGRYLYANPAWVRLTGQKIDDVMGKSVLEFPVMSNPVCWHQMIMETATGNEADAEFTFNNRTLGLRTLQVRFIPERLADGRVQAVFAMGRDVTELRQAELRLQESETLSAGVISAIPDILFEMNRQGQYLDVWTQNPDVLAAQESAIRGKSVHDILSRENAVLAMDAIRKADKNGFAYGLTLLIEQNNGEKRWYEHSIGKKSRSTISEATFIVLSRDVTERKLAEQRLAEAHAFTKHLLNAIPDPVFVKDRRHHWLLLNNAFCTLFGYKYEDFVGKTSYDILPEEEANKYWRADEAVLVSRQESIHEEYITDVQGVKRRLQTKKTVADNNGEEILIGVIRDITEITGVLDALNIKQKSLAEAQRIGRMGSWELDLQSGKMKWSDEIYRIFEIDKADFKTSYEEYLKLIHPDDRAAVDQAFTESLRNHKPYAIDHRLLFPDNRIKYIHESCETSYDEKGLAVMSYGTVQDITEIKETELKLERSQSELRRLAAYRNTLLENERRTVARAMHEEFAQMVAIIHMKVSQLNSITGNSSPAAQALIADTLAISNATMRKMRDMVATMHPTTLDIGIVATLQGLVAEFTKNTAIHCSLKVPQVEPELSDTQVIIVFRLVQEALSNITLHAEARQVDITLVVDRDHYLVKIEDNGKGITSDDLKVPGFGMISMREQATALGGTLIVEPRFNGGVSISVRFPFE